MRVLVLFLVVMILLWADTLLQAYFDEKTKDHLPNHLGSGFRYLIHHWRH